MVQAISIPKRFTSDKANQFKIIKSDDLVRSFQSTWPSIAPCFVIPDNISITRFHQEYCWERRLLVFLFDRLDLLHVFDLQPINFIYIVTRTHKQTLIGVFCVRAWKKCFRIFTRANFFCVPVHWHRRIIPHEMSEKALSFDWKRADVLLWSHATQPTLLSNFDWLLRSEKMTG